MRLRRVVNTLDAVVSFGSGWEAWSVWTAPAACVWGSAISSSTGPSRARESFLTDLC